LHARTEREEVKRERGVKVRSLRVQGGKGKEGRRARPAREGKESRKQAESEEEEGGETEQQRQEEGGEQAKDERAGELEEGMISRVGPECKGAAEDTFANCLKDSSGDLLDRLPKQFRT
jgi:hypothetical protein